MKNNTWTLIVREIERISPRIISTLNPPATMEEIEQLEIKLGIKLPEEFVSYLQTFNGQNLEKVGTSFYLIGFNRFLSVQEIIDTIDMQLDLFGDEDPIDHLTENKVKPVFWDKLWIPFSDFEATTRLILDLNAGRNGKNGQVFMDYPGIDLESDEIVLASSFDKYGKELLRRLKSGEYELDDNYRITFDDNWMI